MTDPTPPDHHSANDQPSGDAHASSGAEDVAPAEQLVFTDNLPPPPFTRPLPAYRISAQQVQWLIVVGFVATGYALYLRYFAIEYSPVGLACGAGLRTWLCTTRELITALFRQSVFGIVALICGALFVIRPSLVLLTLGLIAASFGIVLYNIGLSGLAVGLMFLGFARPARAIG